jgi:tetratricopeptide (TPR) repeat protein
MQQSTLRLVLASITLVLLGAAQAAEPWDAPAFTTPAGELLRSATAIKRDSPANVTVLLDERVFVLDERHRLTRTDHLVYRVDSPDGVEKWAASGTTYQPWHQDKPDINARVITPDGREHRLDQKLLVDVTKRDSAQQIYDDDRHIEGPLPAVTVGAVVEEHIVVRDREPFFAAGLVHREFVGRPVPVLLTRIVIEAPDSLPIKRALHLLPGANAKETRANGRVRWTVEVANSDEMTEMENNLPPDVAGWPSVEFSSAPSWEHVATAYRDMTEARIRTEDAKPLLAGLTPPTRSNTNNALPNSPSLEFIGKVVQKLHREVRYTGIEFGTARLIPEFPAETLRRKFGDCKDKSTLLIAALRAAGIEAYLALLAAGNDQDVSPELPGMGMFDHAIVYLPGTPELWIDATAEYTRVGVLPTADADRLALVIREGTRELKRTPAPRSSDNRQIELREFTLNEYGPANVVEVTDTFGSIETEYRSWYAGADTKERTDDLAEYTRTAYRAKKLANYSHTSSTDFSRPYQLRLEMSEAPVGFTDLETAAVGINVANITTRMPEYFDNKVAEDPANPTKVDYKIRADKSPRHADVVFEPFQMEWHYHLIPPAGFQARKLPQNVVTNLGPAKLEQKISVEKDGSIHARWTFDTVKGRYTLAESEALVKALRELNDAETMLLAFDQIGVALRADGDYKGALAANESLVAKYPKKAVHRLRSATALLEAGLDLRARREAQAATKLEPKSSLAWKTYGWMLQHDAVGRRFGEGYDRAGAIAAYRKALELEPDNTDIAADLAVLLEHNHVGVRYTSKPDIEAAIEVYRKRREHLDEKEREKDTYADNLYFAMLYAGHYQELRETLKGLAPTASRRAIVVAATGAQEGGAKAIEAAFQVAASDPDRRKALANAANILVHLRQYPAAADVLEASTKGETITAQVSQRIAALRKTERTEPALLAATDARTTLLRSFLELLTLEDGSARFAKRLSQHAAAVGNADVEDLDSLQRLLNAGLRRQDMPRAVVGDLMIANLRVAVAGDDASGYRITMRSPGNTITAFVIREDNEYRMLAVGSDLAALGLVALEAADAGNLVAARRWLDWARTEIKNTSSDDPLGGPVFARLWVAGSDADVHTIRAAAAALLTRTPIADRAVQLLNAARPAVASDAQRTDIDVALAQALSKLARWTELGEVSARLLAAHPSSELAFRNLQWANVRLGRWEALDAAAQARLTRLPDDTIARHVLANGAEERGEFGKIEGILRPIIDSGRATASDYNQYAWSALLAPTVSEGALEAARTAFDETQGRNFAVAHTLACLYAVSGKPREARDLLLKGMDQLNLTKPNDATWYGFGLVAESYGDAASAREYYTRVEKPKEGVITPSSLYALSQKRLTVLAKK